MPEMVLMPVKARRERLAADLAHDHELQALAVFGANIEEIITDYAEFYTLPEKDVERLLDLVLTW